MLSDSQEDLVAMHQAVSPIEKYRNAFGLLLHLFG
jgi:hypothetical protein